MQMTHVLVKPYSHAPRWGDAVSQTGISAHQSRVLISATASQAGAQCEAGTLAAMYSAPAGFVSSLIGSQLAKSHGSGSACSFINLSLASISKWTCDEPEQIAVKAGRIFAAI